MYSRGRLLGSLVALVLILGISWARIYELTIKPLLAEGGLRLQRLVGQSPALPLWWRDLAALFLDAVIIVATLVASLWLVSRFMAEAGEAGRWKQKARGPLIERFTLGQRVQYLWGLAALLALYATSLLAHLDLADRALALTLHVYAGAALGVLVVAHIAYYGGRALAALARGMGLRSQFPLLRVFSASYIRDFTRMILQPLGARPSQGYGRYDPGQVFEYWVILLSMIVAGVTGLPVALYGPAVLDGALWVIHWRTAILATTMLLLLHIGYDHLRPRVFPLDTSFLHGRIPLERAQEEYPELVSHVERREAVPEKAKAAH